MRVAGSKLITVLNNRKSCIFITSSNYGLPISSLHTCLLFWLRMNTILHFHCNRRDYYFYFIQLCHVYNKHVNDKEVNTSYFDEEICIDVSKISIMIQGVILFPQISNTRRLPRDQVREGGGAALLVCRLTRLPKGH